MLKQSIAQGELADYGTQITLRVARPAPARPDHDDRAPHHDDRDADTDRDAPDEPTTTP